MPFLRIFSEGNLIWLATVKFGPLQQGVMKSDRMTRVSCDTTIQDLKISAIHIRIYIIYLPRQRIYVEQNEHKLHQTYHRYHAQAHLGTF